MTQPHSHSDCQHQFQRDAAANSSSHLRHIAAIIVSACCHRSTCYHYYYDCPYSYDCSSYCSYTSLTFSHWHFSTYLDYWHQNVDFLVKILLFAVSIAHCQRFTIIYVAIIIVWVALFSWLHKSFSPIIIINSTFSIWVLHTLLLLLVITPIKTAILFPLL